MDDPYPSWRPVILAGADAAVWLVWIAAILAVVLATTRRCLESFSSSRILERLPSGGSRRRFERYFQHVERTVVGTALLLVVSEIVLVLALAQWIAMARPFGVPAQGVGFLLACGLPAALFLVPFCQVIPRALARSAAAEVVVRAALPLLHVVSTVLSPLIWPLERLRHRIVTLGHNGDGDPANHITDGILSVVEAGEREGLIEEDEADMIESVVEFRDVEVSEVMTPRTDMKALDAEMPMASALQIAREGGPSRIPVYEKNQDRIIGILYVKDLLAYVGRDASELPDLRALIRPAYFIPETKKVGQLLKDFRAQKVHIAIVLDEYGGTAGLITIEDILEEIVGEIVDEYDDEPDDPVKHVGPNSADVDARVRIDELNEEMSIQLPESDDFDTVGGYVFSTMGKIPKVGDTLVHGNVELQILSADDRTVKRVLVRVLERRD